MKDVRLVVVLACMGASGIAEAQLTYRCTSDDRLLTPAQRAGRNAWSRKCGYISATRESNLNAFSEYQVYANGCFQQPCAPKVNNCVYFVPASESAPCVSGLSPVGSCEASLDLAPGDSLLASIASPATRYLWGSAPGLDSIFGAHPAT
ncbi:hypothetical protein [Vitiosangium sp. GDMCC 1.1324]|uniref:hypothetical protein n=1 Tax=Vitiosangium sp. (strain GDMCC 1.1324) TaxID=2138576 RepID=UPI000D3BE092|nr:hypothetical protein [Vitiosangium sp. GDMCC 1.1324]PTL75314.1 hypothetical protein DAT35_55770 [Vitiosangium sp. GDMCC 1.1324]